MIFRVVYKAAHRGPLQDLTVVVSLANSSLWVLVLVKSILPVQNSTLREFFVIVVLQGNVPLMGYNPTYLFSWSTVII